MEKVTYILVAVVVAIFMLFVGYWVRGQGSGIDTQKYADRLEEIDRRIDATLEDLRRISESLESTISDSISRLDEGIAGLGNLESEIRDITSGFEGVSADIGRYLDGSQEPTETQPD